MSLNFLLGFVLGLLLGGTAFIAYGYYQLSKLKKTRDDVISKIKKLKDDVESPMDESLAKSIRDRLIKAADLAEQQMELRAQAEMPSKNSLHSRHKNGIIGQIKDLEAEKIQLLKSVLGDGFDPLITVMKEGGLKEDIHLSAYLAEAEEYLASVTPPPPPESKSDPMASGPRKAGKFMIYSGGKNDSDGGTVH